MRESEILGRVVGARPWQINFSYPPPGVASMAEVPFQLSVEDAGDFWILWQRPTPSWMRLPETWKRVGAAIALDLMLPLFAEKIYQIASDHAPIEKGQIVWRSEPTQEIPARWAVYPEELISNMEEWTALWEREPSLNSAETRKRYLARRFFHDLGWALPVVLVQPPMGAIEMGGLWPNEIVNLSGSWLDFIDPYDDVEDRHEEYNFKPTMTIMRSLTAIAIDPLPIPLDCEKPAQRTAWTCASPSYDTAEERIAALLQVTKPLEHWYGIWWREFQNSIPIKEQAGIR